MTLRARVARVLTLTVTILLLAVFVVGGVVVADHPGPAGLVALAASLILLAVLLVRAGIALAARFTPEDSVALPGRPEVTGSDAGPADAVEPGRGEHAGSAAPARDVGPRRDELHRGLVELGHTLASTHDLDRLLEVTLRAAVEGLGAVGGLVMVSTASGDLTLVAEHGLDGMGILAPTVARRGRGVLGGLVARSTPLRGELGSTAELAPLAGEPERGELLAAPLLREDQVVAVLALLNPEGAAAFTAADEAELVGFLAQAAIAVDNVLLHREAQRLSVTDALTGLWNFRYLSLSLAREVERAIRFDRPLALLMVDLDHFKDVNDSHGHQTGDAVLVEVGRRLGEQVREVDVLARYGGEEFLLILPETDAEGAARLAARVVACVGEPPFAVSDPPLLLTVSVGSAVFPEHGRSAAALVAAADRALYQAKEAGRNRWRMAPAG